MTNFYSGEKIIDNVNLNYLYSENKYLELETNSSQYSEFSSEINDEINLKKKEENVDLYNTRSNEKMVAGELMVNNPDNLENKDKNTLEDFSSLLQESIFTPEPEKNVIKNIVDIGKNAKIPPKNNDKNITAKKENNIKKNFIKKTPYASKRNSDVNKNKNPNEKNDKKQIKNVNIKLNDNNNKIDNKINNKNDNKIF